MNNRRYRLPAFIGPLLMLTACIESMPSYRYEMTVEVETPEGLRTGSSVIEVQSQSQSGIVNNGVSRLTGESAVVDLGKRGKLFALLCSDGDIDWGKTLFAHLVRPVLRDLSKTSTQDMRANVEARIADKRTHVLPRYFEPLPYLRDSPPPPGYPMLVRFTDTRNPRRVQYVSPDDLAATFGSGVRLRRITARITDKPVTPTILRLLQWLSGLHTHLDGAEYSNGLISDPANLLSSIDFKRKNI